MALELVFVTGMSGAGKSTALKIMEDLGFFCVDNLPISLIEKFVQLTLEGEEGKIHRISMGVDIRSMENLSDLSPILSALQNEGINYKILFLDADDSTLVKRYKETRRNHPLAKEGRIETGVAQEREALGFLKEKADYIIDTSQLLARDLRGELERIFIEQESFRNLMVTVLSFGFKYGVMNDADLTFDVRCLPNPFYIPELKHKTGLNPEVSGYVMSFKEAQELLDKLNDLIDYLIPLYEKEGKAQLVIAFGCTGGKHRSVTFAEAVAKHLTDNGKTIRLAHRDIEKR